MGGYYHFGGYPYFVGGYPYHVSFLMNAMLIHSTIMLVTPHYYGYGGYGYAHGHRASSRTLQAAHDQYTVSVAFTAPKSHGWTLDLLITNATVFTNKQTDEAPIYLSFTSTACAAAADADGCASMRSLAKILQALG